MPPGLPQGLKSSFYVPSGNSKGSDKPVFFKPPSQWLMPRKGPTPFGEGSCAASAAYLASGVTAGTAKSLGRTER